MKNDKTLNGRHQQGTDKTSPGHHKTSKAFTILSDHVKSEIDMRTKDLVRF